MSERERERVEREMDLGTRQRWIDYPRRGNKVTFLPPMIAGILSFQFFCPTWPNKNKNKNKLKIVKEKASCSTFLGGRGKRVEPTRFPH
jgi:hypothetical protein